MISGCPSSSFSRKFLVREYRSTKSSFFCQFRCTINVALSVWKNFDVSFPFLIPHMRPTLRIEVVICVPASSPNLICKQLKLSSHPHQFFATTSVIRQCLPLNALSPYTAFIHQSRFTHGPIKQPWFS